MSLLTPNQLRFPEVIVDSPQQLIKIQELRRSVYGLISEVIYRGEHYVVKDTIDTTYPTLCEIYVRSTFVHQYMCETNYIFFQMDDSHIKSSIMTKKYQEINQELPFIDILISQLLVVLSFLESNGVIHGDIKQHNILYTIENGQPVLKLIDFGLIHSVTETTCTPSQTLVSIEHLVARYDDIAKIYADIHPIPSYRSQRVYAMYATAITILWMLGVIGDNIDEIYSLHYNLRTRGKEWLKSILITKNKGNYYNRLEKMIYHGDKTKFSDFAHIGRGSVRKYNIAYYYTMMDNNYCSAICRQLELSSVTIRRARNLYQLVSNTNNHKISILCCIIMSIDDTMFIDQSIDKLVEQGICTKSAIIKGIFNMMINTVYLLPMLCRNAEYYLTSLMSP
jgi:serine/threonine protein kinase